MYLINKMRPTRFIETIIASSLKGVGGGSVYKNSNEIKINIYDKNLQQAF